MLVPDGSKVPPITLFNDKDVEIMTSVRDYMSEAVLYVTSGPGLVAKYQFFGRLSFTINDKTYLEEGITEDQHRQAIQSSVLIIHKLYVLLATVIGALPIFNFKYMQDFVGGHPIVCSKHMLEIMFNEPQLLIVFCVALEI